MIDVRLIYYLSFICGCILLYIFYWKNKYRKFFMVDYFRMFRYYGYVVIGRVRIIILFNWDYKLEFLRLNEVFVFFLRGSVGIVFDEIRIFVLCGRDEGL